MSQSEKTHARARLLTRVKPMTGGIVHG